VTRATPPSTTDGLWKATFTLSAGTYAWKVAINNSWDINYGAGGAAGGSDIPLVLEIAGPGHLRLGPGDAYPNSHRHADNSGGEKQGAPGNFLGAPALLEGQR
jgi:hypothetical protein